MGKKVTPKPTAKPMTLAAFARELGVDRVQVTKAIASGRLAASVGRNSRGGPCISDVALAKKEWAENVKGQTGGAQSVSLAEWNRRLTAEKTRAATLANDQREGSLMPVEIYERDAFEDGRMIREAMLNIPDRVAGELAAETSESKVHAKLDKEIRSALEGAYGALAGKKSSPRKKRTG
jgi:hypothetical protein